MGADSWAFASPGAADGPPGLGLTKGEMSAHGFRTMVRRLLDEAPHFPATSSSIHWPMRCTILLAARITARRTCGSITRPYENGPTGWTDQ